MPIHHTRITLLIATGVICVLLAILATSGYRYIEARDFWLHAKVPCDATATRCFTEVDDSESAFTVVHIKAFAAPDCDGWQENSCPNLSCDGLSHEICRTYSCSEETLSILGIETACSE